MSSPADIVNTAKVTLGVTWGLTALCIVAIVARFVVRTTVSKSLGSDDWVMLLAVIIQIIYQSFITLSSEAKVGSIGAEAPDPNAVKFAVYAVAPATLAAVTARISAAILLVRLFGTKSWFKWYMIIFTTVMSVLGLVAIVIFMGRTNPLEAIWQPAKFQGYRWSASTQKIPSTIVAVLFALSDITFVVFPVMIVWKLQMPLGRKIGLIVLLALSMVTLAASILKGLITLGADLPGMSATTENGLLWAGVEQTLVVILGCVPALGPLVRRAPAFAHWCRSLTSRVTDKNRSSDRSSRMDGFPSHGSAGFQEIEIHSLDNAARKHMSVEEQDELTLVTSREGMGAERDFESDCGTTDGRTGFAGIEKPRPSYAV